MELAKFPFRAKSKCRTVCAVKGCTSRLDKDLDVIFHSFPTVQRVVTITNVFGKLEKIDQVKAWKRALKIENINSSTRVCSLHFRKDDYVLPDVAVKRRKLKRNAVPSINLPNIKIDNSRETRTINRHKKIEELIAKQEENIVPEELDHNSSNRENLWNVQAEIIPARLPTQDIEVQVTNDLPLPRFVNITNSDAELNTLAGTESFLILTTIVDIFSVICGDNLHRVI